MCEDSLSAQIFGEILADVYADIDVTEGMDIMDRAAGLKEEAKKEAQQTNKKAEKNTTENRSEGFSLEKYDKN